MITSDLPCLECGYNLRGLPRYGRCPECGVDVGPSVDRLNARTLADADARWLRRLSEGSIVGLAALVICLAVAGATPWWFTWRSQQRIVTLGALCTAWVLTGAAAWRLSEREPNSSEETETRLPRVLRATASVYVMAPILLFYFEPRTTTPGWWWVVVIAYLVAGLIASAGYFLRIAALAARNGARFMPIEARVLGIFSVIVYVIALMPAGHGSPDSLSSMLGSNYLGIGEPKLLRDMMRLIGSRSIPHPIEIAGIIFPLWSAVILARAVLMFRRASARDSLPRYAGGGRG
jgi:hypothetical protein